MVPVFVPPAVFEEEVAILDLPMIAYILEQSRCTDPLGSQAGDEVARVVQDGRAGVVQHVAIDPQRNAATRER